MWYTKTVTTLLLSIVLYGISLYPTATVTHAALTEAEEAKLNFESGNVEVALAILKTVWERDKSYGAGVGYAYYLGAAGKIDEASAVFETVINQFPDKKAADLEYAILLKREQQLEKAEQVLKALYLRRPKDVQAVKEYAGVLLGVKKIADALIVLENFTPTSDDRFDYLTIFGAAQFEAKNYDAALAAYEELITIDNSIIDFHLSIGKCYRKMRVFNQAKIFYTELKVLFPDSGDPWFENAALYLDINELDNAKKEFIEAKAKYTAQGNENRATASQNQIDEVDWKLGKSLMSREDYSNACPKIYEVYVRNPQTHFGLDGAVCYRLDEQLNVSKVLFIKLLHKNPNNSTIFLEYFETLKAQGNYKEAKRLLLEFVGEYGYSNPKVVSRLAGIYLGAQEYQNALDTLADGRKQLDGNPVPLSFILIAGTAHRSLGNNQIAEVLFTKAREQAPDLLDVLLELIDTKNKDNRTIESETQLAEWYEDKGLDARVLNSRAKIYLTQQKWDEAIRDCKQVLTDPSMSPDQRQIITAKILILDARTGLAKRSMNLGQYEKAANEFHALRIDEFRPEMQIQRAIDLAATVPFVGESDRTDDVLGDALVKDSNNVNIKQVWGEVLLQEHRANQVLDTVGLIVGKDHMYQYGRSILVLKSLMEMGRWDDLGDTLYAIDIQDEALKLVDSLGNPIPQMRRNDIEGVRAIYYEHTGRTDRAIQIYKSLAEATGLPDFELSIVNIYRRQKQNDEAKALLLDMLDRYPLRPGGRGQKDKAKVLQAYGSFMLGQNEPEEWQRAGQESIEILKAELCENFWQRYESGKLDIPPQPTATEYHYSEEPPEPNCSFAIEFGEYIALGNAYFGIMDFDNAERIYTKVLQYFPKHYKAQSTLGHLYLEQRDYHRASNAFDNAYKIQPKNPYALVDLINVYLRAGHPGKARDAELKAMPHISGFEDLVLNIKKSSIGTLAYRPIPQLGLVGSVTRLSVRPHAMTLVRETAFSDQPVAGFQIDQSVLNQSFNFVGPETAKYSVDYTHVNSSGSLDVVANLFEFKRSATDLLPNGVLQKQLSGIYLLENEKYAQTTARGFPMVKFVSNYKPTGSSILYGGNVSYGVQRLDKYGLPTEFFLGNGSVAWSKGLDSLFQSVSFRRDKLPSGTNFNSIMTETAAQSSFEKFIYSALLQTEQLQGLPKLNTAFGFLMLGKLEYNVNDHLIPYSSLVLSRSRQYEFNNVFQADIGLRYQNAFLGKTRDMDRWYEYPVPYQIQLSYQQYWYPNSTVPTSRTLFLTARII